MVTTTRRGGHRARNSLARTVGALVACGLAVGLGGPSSAAEVPAKVPDSLVTVEELKDWALQGTTPEVMKGKIDASGTVYRMTAGVDSSMRAAGVPPGLVSYMDLLYTNAVKHNPSLATSDEHWTKVGSYQYGGKPFGWPADWVTGAPPLGAGLKGEGDKAVHPPGAEDGGAN
jgi:hypothetical protein